jgi:cell wall-associated NlpC family hydrolase
MRQQLTLVAFLALALSLCSCNERGDRGESATTSSCSSGPATVTDGYRRLALIVGVGDYQAEEVDDLRGSRADAERFYDLLTRADGGYGFPKENVCLVLDGDATTDRFKQLFRESLTARVEDQADVAVFYFAGHGSQVKDDNGDEPDEFDETLLFHDSRTAEMPADLPDDELNELLSELSARTRHAAVILDSCNSGSATRAGANDLKARFQPPAPVRPGPAAATATRGDEASGWAPEHLEGLVAFVAATDGTPALERNGRGVFTDALLTVLSGVGPTALTYAQAARQIPPLVSAVSYQVPFFEGDLLKSVFGNTARDRPASWEVREVKAGDAVDLSGPPLPGIGVGAELRIYAGSATGAETRDPGKAKALVVVTEATGLNASARVAAGDASSISVGDVALLARVGDESTRISVSLRPEDRPAGIPAARASELREAIEADAEAAMLVEIVADGGEFELGLSSDGTLQLWGPENRVRNRFEDASNLDEVVESLWKHARQRALLQLHGEGGDDFTDQATLQAEIVPAAKKGACADGTWYPSKPNEEQIIPLCHQWNVRVTLDKNAPAPLLVGGLVLSNDGATLGFPYNGRKELLQPGDSVTFAASRETFRAGPPLDVQDHVLVFGTQETNPVAWHLFAGTAGSRSAMRSSAGSLARALDRYLQPGTRSQSVGGAPEEDTTWTMTRLPLRVEANSRFLNAEQAQKEGDQTREYTILSFDVRPYLPDDPNSALYKVLMTAHSLAVYSDSLGKDGVPYKQHDWSRPSDRENLALGIDCSRSIWYAFGRSGLPYNEENRYLQTAIMVGDDSAMAQQFQSCSNDPNLQTGDVLVYRDEGKSVGHTVMVIDPEKRIAWGSHGWDGNENAGLKADTGVEYQLIKYKKDWERWDTKTMERKACWRYKDFAGVQGRGIAAITKACDDKLQCGRVSVPSVGGSRAARARI